MGSQNPLSPDPVDPEYISTSLPSLILWAEPLGDSFRIGTGILEGLARFSTVKEDSHDMAYYGLIVVRHKY